MSALSTSEIIGIAIAIALLGILAIAALAVIFVVIHRSRRSRVQAVEESERAAIEMEDLRRSRDAALKRERKAQKAIRKESKRTTKLARLAMQQGRAAEFPVAIASPTSPPSPSSPVLQEGMDRLASLAERVTQLRREPGLDPRTPAQDAELRMLQGQVQSLNAIVEKLSSFSGYPPQQVHYPPAASTRVAADYASDPPLSAWGRLLREAELDDTPSTHGVPDPATLNSALRKVSIPPLPSEAHKQNTLLSEERDHQNRLHAEVNSLQAYAGVVTPEYDAPAGGSTWAPPAAAPASGLAPSSSIRDLMPVFPGAYGGVPNGSITAATNRPVDSSTAHGGTANRITSSSSSRGVKAQNAPNIITSSPDA